MSGAADWTEVRKLFEGASGLSGTERSSYLERECGGDAELRREVLSLLESAEKDDAFLETPVGNVDSMLAAPLSVGTCVGEFRLVRRIAAGGMGVVYEAEQEEPRRRVALKVMRLGLETEGARRRFRYEAEILAGLRHPGIAPIFSTGVHEIDGQQVPWFAMELVEGARTIVQHAEERGISLAERLQLFREVCDAVHHGHLRGVVHRDLKPDNILVDAGGRARLIDFGVARVADSDLALSTLLTEQGAVIGTLSTMSPEQIAGDPDDVDLRTDVFALGVVLYQLLTGALPHDLRGRSLPEAARILREDPPARPSRHDARLAGDLETILLKALEKEPARRYASAAELGQDLGRFLAREPILARPPSALYQVRMFARRHRTLATAAVSIFVVAIVGAAISLRYAFRAERAADDAERRFGIVRAVGEDLMGSVLDGLEGLEGATRARAEIAATAVEYLDALEREAGDDVELLRELARGYHRLGSFQGAPTDPSLGEARAAARSYEHALLLSERIAALTEAGGEIAADRRARLAVTLDLARVLPRLGRAEESAALYGALLDEPEAGELTAATHCGLSDLARSAGDHDAARGHLEEARRLYRELGAPEDEAVVLERLGNLALENQHFEEAERHYEDLRERRDGSSTGDPLGREGRIERVNLLANLANLAERKGHGEEARGHATEAVSLARAALASNPKDAFVRDRLAWVLDVRGASLRMLGELEAAHADFAESADLYEENLALDPEDLYVRTCAAEMRVKQAGMLLADGRADEALELLDTAVSALERVRDDDATWYACERPLNLGLDVLTQALLATGQIEDARHVVAEFLEASERFAARAPDDAFAQRQVMLAHDRVGAVRQMLAEDESEPLDVRIDHYGAAASAYDACLAAIEELREAGFLYPSDERAARSVEEARARCEEALVRLEAETEG